MTNRDMYLCQFDRHSHLLGPNDQLVCDLLTSPLIVLPNCFLLIKWLIRAVLQDIKGMLVVSECFNTLVLHELCRSDINQNLGCVTHLQVVVLVADLDGQERFLVELHCHWEIIMFSKRVAKLIHQFEGKDVIKVLLETSLSLLNELLCFGSPFASHVQID